MRRSAFIALALSCLLSAAVTAADKPEPPPKDIAELQTRLAALLKEANVPGGGVALFDRSGVTWAGGIGYAERESRKPVTADTLFRVGSITKGFVAAALLKLAEKGAFRLDARLKDVAPEIPVSNPWEDTDPVTLAEVLEHTAGFDDMHFPRLYNFHEPEDIPLFTVLQRSSPELKVRWRPGSRMSYSNPDYLIAGYLVEKFSGMSYERYVTEQVLRPLGMIRASLTLDPVTLSALAQGYEGDTQAPVKPAAIYLRPAGALAASPQELAHFGVMLLNRGTWQNGPFLSAASVTRMETPATSDAARHGLDFGYGLANYTAYIGGYEFHGHDGGIDGFDSRYAYAPDQGVGFVLLLNSSDPGEAMHEGTKLIVSYLMRGQPQPLMPSPSPVNATALSAAAGCYREENPRNQVMAVADYLVGVGCMKPDGKGGLTLKALFDDPVTLVPAGTGLWREPDHPGPDSVSYVDAGGEEILDRPIGEHWAKTGVLVAYGPLVLFLAALLLMFSTVLFAPVWLLRLAFGRMRGVKHWSLRLLTLAAASGFALMLLSLMGIQPIELGSPNAHTVMFFLASLLFALASAAALAQSIRSFKWDVNRWLRWHSLAASSACAALALFLAYWGLIGLRMWDF